MNLLVLSAGSSSLKFRVISTGAERIASGGGARLRAAVTGVGPSAVALHLPHAKPIPD